MEAATTVDQIVSYVGAHNARAQCLIGVDGFDGTGKTTLAFQLAAQLNGIRVGLDCYVAKERPGDNYVDLLRTEHLKRDLFNLAIHFPVVVVDGVCLLAALESVGMSPDLLVYVKKVSPQGIWHDGFHLENHIAGEPADSWLDKSVYAYHQAQQPQTKASICYQRSEV